MRYLAIGYRVGEATQDLNFGSVIIVQTYSDPTLEGLEKNCLSAIYTERRAILKGWDGALK